MKILGFFGTIEVTITKSALNLYAQNIFSDRDFKTIHIFFVINLDLNFLTLLQKFIILSFTEIYGFFPGPPSYRKTPT